MFIFPQSPQDCFRKKKLYLGQKGKQCLFTEINESENQNEALKPNIFVVSQLTMSWDIWDWEKKRAGWGSFTLTQMPSLTVTFAEVTMLPGHQPLPSTYEGTGLWGLQSQVTTEVEKSSSWKTHRLIYPQGLKDWRLEITATHFLDSCSDLQVPECNHSSGLFTPHPHLSGEGQLDLMLGLFREPHEPSWRVDSTWTPGYTSHCFCFFSKLLLRVRWKTRLLQPS